MSDRIQEVAERANVPEEFVRQLVAADALVCEEGELELAGAVRRVRLLRSWTAAGLSVETILTLVNRGALSLAFLDAPLMALPERPIACMIPSGARRRRSAPATTRCGSGGGWLVS